MRPDVDSAFRSFASTGDPRSLGRVFDLLAPDLLIVAAHLVGGKADPEDVVQTTFVRAIQWSDRYDPARPVRPWLVGILAKTALMELRDRRRQPDPARLAAARDVRPPEAAEAQEVAVLVAEALDQLPVEQRQVLHLRLVHGFKVAQIARALAVPLPTAKARLRRGLARLRGLLPAGIAPALAAVLTIRGRGLAAVRAEVLAQLPPPGYATATAVVQTPRMGSAVLMVGAGLALFGLFGDVPAPGEGGPWEHRQARAAGASMGFSSKTGVLSEEPSKQEETERQRATNTDPGESSMRSPTLTRAAAAATTLLAATVTTQSPFATISGASSAGWFGQGVTIMGDVDGDGFDEYVVTSPIEHHVFSGRTGVEIARVVGEVGHDNRAVDAAGDVNNDGWPDLIVGREGNFGPPIPGVATVLSGKDWSEIWEWTGSVVGEGYSFTVAGLGDCDGDGHDDVGVSSAQWGTPLPGYVEVRSGRTGGILLRADGYAVSAAGDLDGDGLADMVVPDPNTNRAIAYSVATGAVIHSWAGALAFGQEAAPVGDIDGDGLGDVAIGDPQASLKGARWTGAVRVFSGRTGGEIRTLWGAWADHRFGDGVNAVGDVNGDGRVEIIVVAGNLAGAGDKTVSIIDVANQVKLFSETRPKIDSFRWVGAGGDVNGDGVPDAIVGAPQPNLPQPAGYALLISGADLSLTTDTPFLSVASGGSQSLQIDAGASFAGNVYLVLGSASGISPGVTLGGMNVPLNFDGYMLHTAQFANLAPLVNTLGVLDASGQAAAAWSIPPGLLAGLAGISFEHAYVVLSPAGLPVFVSNPMPLTFVN